jgi:predicted TIM-barrel fold metal-dependent hydrolase
MGKFPQSRVRIGRLSRRSFLQGVAAAGAGALLPRIPLWAQKPAIDAHVIDCHHHFASPAYLKALGPKEGHIPRGFTTNLTWVHGTTTTEYSPAKDLEENTRQGVATAMLSCTTPGIWFGDPEETRHLARDMNDFGAKIVSDYKGHFGLFALLPLPVIDDSLHEIAYALDTLKADGVGILTSYGDHWLGDPIFRPVFDELNRRKALVYVHPTDAPCCGDLIPGIASGAVEWETDTSRTIFSLLANGAATRYSDIRFIFSHGGGTMPSLVERFGVGGPDNVADNLAHTPEMNSRLYHLRRFYYDTAQSTNPVKMTGLKMVVGSSQIVFGSDHIDPMSPGIEKHLQGLQKCNLSAQELKAIYRENAERLFPRLKGVS